MDGITISIHTPAQGVTYLHDTFQVVSTYFNPHSRTGSDGLTGRSLFVRLNFNPHSRTGSDCTSFILVFIARISIHTPAQGVTVSLP